MVKLAIVGRPNVGKSTLFNRLAGRKLAIVDDRPGVTRDRRFGTGRLGDIDLELIDTAGFEDQTDESLEARMRRQTELALADAEVILFVVDAREGVTPLDEVFAAILRRTDKPVIMVANKAEGQSGEAGTMEAFGLGFGEPVPISAEHNEGMAELYAAVAAAAPIADAFEDDEDDDERGDKPVRIAIVGRPNAGKSTLVNRLIGEDRLLTGPEAGITRDAIPVDWTWEGRNVRLVDTAGLRRKARVQEKLEKLSTADSIRAITFAEVVILVMDATHPFETQDLQIADLVEREGRGLVFVLAKWDLVEDPGSRLAAFVEHAERMLPQLRGAPVVALSAETGRGLERLMPAVLKAHKDWATKIKTRDLNDWLQLAIQRHPPPAVNGRRIKPKYMAQTKARPPTFVLFSSRADQLPDSYRRYLINSLRQSFDMPGTPIRITIKSGANPYADDAGDSAPPRRASAPRTRAVAKRTQPAGEGGEAAAAARPARKPRAAAGGKAKAGPVKKKVGLKARAGAAAKRAGSHKHAPIRTKRDAKPSKPRGR
ncbi:ribosome biogenesis GTPase Der [Caulobacter sp. KR2-114]|uniref:ribosome biogenesis GTPase Der n=1 Tax=Caulobacter sp. KR2-114 TaxID=3400912 RepID=UPI003C107D11